MDRRTDGQTDRQTEDIIVTIADLTAWQYDRLIDRKRNPEKVANSVWPVRWE